MRDLGKLTVNVVQKIAAATGTSAVLGANKGMLGGLIPSAGLKPSTYAYRAAQAISGAKGSLAKIAGKQERLEDLAGFLRRPSARGAQELLGGQFGSMLKGGKAARFAPVITTAISAIGKLASMAGIAALAIGVIISGIKAANAAVQRFVDEVRDYSGSISSGKALADVDRERAKIKAAQGMPGTAGGVFERVMGKFDASMTRFMASITPLLTTIGIPAIELLTQIVDICSAIFEWVNKHLEVITAIIGTVVAAVGVALMATMNPIGIAVGGALAGIGVGIVYMGQKLAAIDRNTRKDDFTAANEPFLADLRLMGAKI